MGLVVAFGMGGGCNTGSGSSFSVGCGDQCGVLHGDYRFPRNPETRLTMSHAAAAPLQKVDFDNIVLVILFVLC